MDLNADISQLSDEELWRLDALLNDRRGQIQAELQARTARLAKAVEETRVMESLWEQRPDLKPAFGDTPETAGEWVQPTCAVDSYPPGAHVTHNGLTWVNGLGVVNPHEPGVQNAGWAEVIQESPADWAVTVEDGTREHPYVWSAGLVLKRGQYIIYEGQLYQLTQDHTAQDHWRPGPGLESIYTPVVG